MLGLDAVALVEARTRRSGARPAGTASANGRSRLLRSLDGWIAVTLARPWDWEATAAWLEADAPDWPAVASGVAQRRNDELVERARLLGLAVARVDGETGPSPPVPDEAGRLDGALVVDLSSLWAGPLCAAVLGWRGARVLKLESAARRDGAATGDPALYAALNAGKEVVVVEVGEPAGRAALDRWLESADVVVEGSRPRALAAWGWDPARALAGRCRAWISLTGYGRADERVAFGDDAAAGAGVVRWDGAVPAFVGDALADPVAGLTAAAAACAAAAGRTDRVVDVSLVGAARATSGRCAEGGPPVTAR